MSEIHLGTSLFSFTAPYIRDELDLEGLIRTSKELGAEGYEIVGAQMIESYPYVSDKVLGEIKAISDYYDIKCVCYGANADKGLLSSRDLSNEEMLQRSILDLQAASRLGCSVMRAQYLMSLEAFEKLAPYAEEYGVKVGIEIHNPDTPSTELTQKVIEVIDRTQSDYLGIVMDLGSFATRPNKPYWDLAIQQGAQPQLLEYAAELKYKDVPRDKAAKLLLEKGANEAVMGAFQNMYGFVTFNKKADLDGLARIMPYINHIHGKCHYISENLQEASIPYNEILPVIKKSDFKGYIVSEFEGQEFYDAITMTRRHLEMERRILEK